MTHSGTNNGDGCFSGFSRLLLCTRSLQTHPSDETLTKPLPTVDHILIKESIDFPPLTSDSKVAATETTTPGVVARLMGLDWLPDAKCGRSAPDLVSRSRSVNFMDYLAGSDLDLKRLNKQQHRRVRTSVSFREDPALSNPENQQDSDLFSFAERRKKNGYRRKKSEENFENVGQRKELEKKKKKEEEEKKKKVNLKDVERRKKLVLNERQTSRSCSCKGGRGGLGKVSPVYVSGGGQKDGIQTKKVKIPVKVMNQKEVLMESRLMKKMKNAKSDSEDSSPISVLDTNEFLLLHQIPLQEKKCSSKTTNFNYKMNRRREGVRDEKKEKRKRCVEEVKKVRRLTDEEIVKLKCGIDFEGNIEEMCSYFGEQIMDLLLQELVEQ